jgi:hypothetical protein
MDITVPANRKSILIKGEPREISDLVYSLKCFGYYVKERNNNR